MPASAKEASVFFPPELVARAKANIAKYPWATKQKENVVQAARPWMKLSDEELWGLMFGPTIHRSWMVLSDGYCPSCKKPVPMYTWEVDALAHPWKVRCPHCREYFPKNDFKAFYQSGLDEHGIFDPKKADRSLLFNAEHSDAKDPLRMFGVDGGDGYVEGDKRWRFIGAYLIYGQWKQAVLNGIRNLAAAYVVTGDPKYAHKAGILLDRVADLYPTFDFMTQADLYDGRNQAAGYVSVWHDACEETRELALGYDMVRDAVPGDKKLVEFLSKKAGGSKDIERNIEDRILRDALSNIPKISSNYPRTQVTQIVINETLGNRDAANAILDPMLEQATAVDGVTGEKGLVDYTAHTIKGVANLLGLLARIDPDFLKETLKRHPRVHDMYRFHIDTWCLGKYYPLVGDCGWFACQRDQYQGVEFYKGFDPAPYMYAFSLSPSMFTFLWQLYELTGDTALVQAFYHANDDKVDGLPYDLFADDPAAFQKAVNNVIKRVGPTPRLKSVNKEQWHLAILRSGEGEDARALWLAYDSLGGHGHANCMEIGLFAKGLDLLPDFGYKPVQFGGWGSPKANWYGKTPAHNTVVVDGLDQGNGGGQTTLWADGKEFHAIRASGPTASGVKQFERTVAMVDISDEDFYILDVFRVVGGKDHAKFTGSHFGTITTQGLSLQPAPDYGNGTQMRNFQVDAKPANPWSVDWKIEDKYKFLPPGSEVHLRYTDLTNGAEAYTAEAWVAIGGYYDTNDEAWIPRIMTRRSGTEPLASTFVAVMEPYEKQSAIAGIKRLALQTEDGTLYPDSFAAVEVSLAGGGKDLLISAGDPGTTVQKDWGVRTDAELCLVRLDASGKVKEVVMCKGSFMEVGGKDFGPNKANDFIEIER